MSVAFPHGYKRRPGVSSALGNLFRTTTGTSLPFSKMSGRNFNPMASAAYVPGRASGSKRNSAGIPIRLSDVKPNVLAQRNNVFLSRVYKKVVQLERKSKTNRSYVDNAFGGVFGTGFTPVHLTGIDQGVAEGTRVGNEIMPTSLEIRGNLVTTAASDTTSRVRLVIVRFKKSLGGTPPTYLNFSTTNAVTSFYDKSEAGHFQILHDRIWSMPGVNYLPESERQVHIKIPLNQKTTYYGSLAANYDSGSIWAFYIGAGWTTTPPQLNMASRLNFSI